MKLTATLICVVAWASLTARGAPVAKPALEQLKANYDVISQMFAEKVTGGLANMRNEQHIAQQVLAALQSDNFRYDETVGALFDTIDAMVTKNMQQMEANFQTGQQLERLATRFSDLLTSVGADSQLRDDVHGFYTTVIPGAKGMETSRRFFAKLRRHYAGLKHQAGKKLLNRERIAQLEQLLQADYAEAAANMQAFMQRSYQPAFAYLKSAGARLAGIAGN